MRVRPAQASDCPDICSAYIASWRAGYQGPLGGHVDGDDVFDIREFGLEPRSMLMIRVYPEISVRVELHRVLDG